MDADQLFLLTVGDLESRVSAAIPRLRPGSPGSTAEQEYNSLMIAPLLRKLLLDEQPLVHVVNRQRRLPLLFPFDHWPLMSGSMSGLPMADHAYVADLLSNEFIDKEGPMTLKEMLATSVMIWNGHRVSAAEVIRHVANVEGGVHLDTPRTDKGRVLRGLEETHLGLGTLTGARLLGGRRESDPSRLGRASKPRRRRSRAPKRCGHQPHRLAPHEPPTIWL